MNYYYQNQSKNVSKPFENHLKNINKMEYKTYSFEFEFERSKSQDFKSMNFSS